MDEHASERQSQKGLGEQPRPRPPLFSRKHLGRIIALVVVAGVAMVKLVQWTRSADAQPNSRTEPGPVHISTATATRGDFDIHISAIGTVTPVYTSSITSQVTGQIKTVHYTEGQPVRAGEPLIDIDSRALDAQLLQAKGVLARDTRVLDQAKMDLERYRTAWAKNAIPKQTLDDQEHVVLQAEATVKADLGTVQYDQVQVSYCHITAPVSGRVGLRLIDPGNIVLANSTTPLVVVTQERPITVIFAIAQDHIDEVQSQMRAGKKLKVEVFDRLGQQKLGEGTLLTLDNQIDTTTGTVKLRALFENAENRLFPNQFVNTRLSVRTVQGVVLVPNSAIQHNGATSFVYVVKNGSVQIRNVKAGISDSGVTVVDGLQPGEVIANSSFERLQPNSSVVIANNAPKQLTTESIDP